MDRAVSARGWTRFVAGQRSRSRRTRRTLRPFATSATVLVDELDARVLQLTPSAGFIRAEKLGSFPKKPRDQSLSLLLWPLSKAHTRSTTILIDELDAGLLKGAPQLLASLI